jgi:mono/diheme cytochrome c family protein
VRRTGAAGSNLLSDEQGEPMRVWGAAILLATAACQRQDKPLARPTAITFDGAQVTDVAAKLAHGERLTHVLGCTGCHGVHLEGTLFTKDHPEYGPLYASNLTAEVPEYSDAQLDGIIRQGVHPERKSVWGMPSQIFHNLSDADLKALIAYLRTLKPIGKKTPPPQFSAQDKKDIAAGLYGPASQLVRKLHGALPADLGPQLALGRYITSVTCTECHGPKLEGGPKGMPPNLVVAGGYTRAEFERLITQGIPVGGRKLNPMMSGVATTRFSHLTPHERDALYAYLKARADKLSR